MERDLEGRVAVVTGAAEGIGFAVAARLAQAGAAVAFADLNVAAAQGKAERLRMEGYQAIALPVDVSSEESVRAMVAMVSAQWGTAEILINNAGINIGATEVERMAIADWDRTMAVNLRSVFLCCHMLLPGMLALGGGRIVNVASVAGKEGNPRMAAYSASKAGVIGFTKALAKEVAHKNIIVNAVSPAVIRTRLNDDIDPSVVAYMVERIPMGRMGEPEEVAALIHWLVGPNCTFTTGQCVDISGGRATY